MYRVIINVWKDGRINYEKIGFHPSLLEAFGSIIATQSLNPQSLIAYHVSDEQGNVIETTDPQIPSGLYDPSSGEWS